jgi:hypothetical protein
VYGIWRAKNAIKHNNRQPKIEEQILKSIFWEVRSQILGKGKFKKNRVNIRICHCWNLDTNLKHPCFVVLWLSVHGHVSALVVMFCGTVFVQV